MLRLFDLQCPDCGTVAETLVEVPRGEKPPATAEHYCDRCGEYTSHERILSAPAQYLGEKVLNPRVYGGKFDTMGHRKRPHLPTLPNGASAMDYKYLFDKPEYKEIERERKEIDKQNNQKRKRAKAAMRGETVNFRTDKCAGDPKITA